MVAILNKQTGTSHVCQCERFRQKVGISDQKRTMPVVAETTLLSSSLAFCCRQKDIYNDYSTSDSFVLDSRVCLRPSGSVPREISQVNRERELADLHNLKEASGKMCKTQLQQLRAVAQHALSHESKKGIPVVIPALLLTVLE